MPEEQDIKLVHNADAILQDLYQKYEEASLADKWMLEPALLKAREELLNARLSLFKKGVLTTSKDLDRLDDIKKEIDSAADTQAIVMLTAKFAAFLSTFV